MTLIVFVVVFVVALAAWLLAMPWIVRAATRVGLLDAFGRYVDWVHRR